MAFDIIARKDAMAQGLKRYFTGKPCRKNSHISQRLCSSGQCLGCKPDPDAERVRQRAKRQRNPETYAAMSARYRAAHPDRCRETVQRWREANTDAWRESNRRSKQANQQKYTDRQRADYALNPEKYRTVERKRRAQIKGGGGTHTADDLDEIFAAQGGRCAYCRADLRRTKKHVDHIKPLSRGGSNGRSNLQYLCAPCNHSKSDREPEAYARSIGLLL